MKFSLIKPATSERRHFMAFYTQYAPLLWGLMVRAGLPAPAAETVLINTFSRAWQHSRRKLINKPQMLTWLLRLAYEEGLPVDTLPARFREIGMNTTRFGKK